MISLFIMSVLHILCQIRQVPWMSQMLQLQQTSMFRHLSQAFKLPVFKSITCKVLNRLRPVSCPHARCWFLLPLSPSFTSCRLCAAPSIAPPDIASCQSLQNFSNPNNKVQHSLPILCLAPCGEVVTCLTLIML